MLRLLAACLALSLATLAGPAHAERRLALVIGNDAYRELPSLKKAAADAAAMAATLRKIGFEVVVGENQSRLETSRRLAELERRIEPGDLVLVFFAGHGVEIDGRNYLLPTDVPKPGAGEESLVRDASFPADTVVERVRARGARTTVLILDACRDNPFPRVGGRTIGGTRGLGRMDTAEGVFILYSAGLQQTALDRLSEDDPAENSVFTRTLLPLLTIPGLSLIDVAKMAQLGVRDLARRARHEQTPAYYDQVLGQLVLVPAVAAPPPSPPPPPRPAPSASPFDERAADLAFWTAVDRDNSAELYEEYLRQFGERGLFVALAKARLERLRAEQRAIVVTPAPASPPALPSPPAITPRPPPPAPAVPPLALLSPPPAPSVPPATVTPDSGRAPVHACDRLAAFPSDADRVVDAAPGGASLFGRNRRRGPEQLAMMRVAYTVCTEAIASHPREGRFAMQRALIRFAAEPRETPKDDPLWTTVITDTTRAAGLGYPLARLALDGFAVAGAFGELGNDMPAMISLAAKMMDDKRGFERLLARARAGDCAVLLVADEMLGSRHESRLGRYLGTYSDADTKAKREALIAELREKALDSACLAALRRADFKGGQGVGEVERQAAKLLLGSHAEPHYVLRRGMTWARTVFETRASATAAPR